MDALILLLSGSPDSKVLVDTHTYPDLYKCAMDKNIIF